MDDTAVVTSLVCRDSVFLVDDNDSNLGVPKANRSPHGESNNPATYDKDT